MVVSYISNHTAIAHIVSELRSECEVCSSGFFPLKNTIRDQAKPSLWIVTASRTNFDASLITKCENCFVIGNVELICSIIVY